MRDTYITEQNSAQIVDDVVKTPLRGMRHSIRPRRKVALDAEDRFEAEEFNAPVENTPARAPAVTDVSVPQWQDLAEVDVSLRRRFASDLPVLDANRDSASVRAFDLLRTRLRQTTRENGWVNIGITAPTKGCGTTFTAANLATSLSRVPGSRTVLMDMNLRNPDIAAAFDLVSKNQMHDYLSGQISMGEHMVRVGETLALGLNGHAHDAAAETLQDPAIARTLDRMRAALRPDLVLYDLPPMLAHDDVTAFTPQLDGILLVSDGTQTMGRQLIECERMLDNKVPLLGVILNRARASSIQRYS